MNNKDIVDIFKKLSIDNKDVSLSQNNRKTPFVVLGEYFDKNNSNKKYTKWNLSK